MDTKEVIEKIVDAFDRSDVEGILDLMTADAVWEMVGGRALVGKDEIRSSLIEMGEMEMLGSTKDHMIIEDATAAVDGAVKYKGKDGQVHEMYYCDVYELKDGKVSKMTSYTVNKK